MTHEMYVRPKYAVSALECYNDLLEIIKNDTLNGMVISRSEYAEMLKISLDQYAKTKGIDDNWSQSKKENAFLVSPKEPHFEWWFSIYLSLVEDYEVPLILDEHNKNWNCTEVNFTDFLENTVLLKLKKNLFHNFESVRKEIISWIRESRYIDQKQSKSKVSYGQSTIIKSPFYEHLLNDLLEFCEEESKEDLKEVLKGGEIKDRVILNSNFKKISFHRALRYLIGQRAVKKNQTEWAIWLLENFCIQSDKGLNQFKKHGSIKALSQPLIETKNSQIKFTSWLKE